MRKTKLSTPAKICNLDRPSCDPVPLSISADGLFNAALWKSWQFEPPAVHQHPERKKVGHPSTQKLVRISSVNLMVHDQVSPWQEQRSSSILSRVSNKWTANFQSVQFLNKTLAWAHTHMRAKLQSSCFFWMIYLEILLAGEINILIWISRML